MAKSTGKTNKISSVNIPNQLNAGTSIQGSIILEGHLRLDGKIMGDITCSGKVVIGEKGEVVGNIHCQSADIMGVVHGEIKVKESASLFAKSMVKGDIYTVGINIEPGAVFNGKCIMGSNEK
jgi:cytoskeletal protein CcmA (bactofilin family)